MKEQIKALLRQRASQKDISHKLGVSRRKVHGILLGLREKGRIRFGYDFLRGCTIQLLF